MTKMPLKYKEPARDPNVICFLQQVNSCLTQAELLATLLDWQLGPSIVEAHRLLQLVPNRSF